MYKYFVYIITNRPNGILYVGVTRNLIKRIYEHKSNIIDSFSKKYNLKNLVYYELHNDIYQAITREKKIKKWRREWKVNLIEKANPNWNDLYKEIIY